MPRPTTPTLTPFTDQLPDVNNAATWATRTPLFWNWVTGDGYTSIADTVAYGDAAADYIDTALAGSETVVDSLANHIADAANPHGVTAAQIGAFPNIDVNGGNIDGTVIGATTAAAGTFTAITSTSDSSLNGLTVGRGAGDISTNTASGYLALNSNTTGSANTASGRQALYLNTTGSFNTASGRQALFSNTTGSANTASGLQALYLNTTGSFNTASGYEALRNNTTGSNNTASGYQALRSNTTGNNNTASGRQALYLNTTGSFNTASGYLALNSNTTGNNNAASGYLALNSNTTGNNNTASGTQALRNNTTSSNNTASGYQALFYNTTGSANTASGTSALFYNTTGSSNTATGYQALRNNTTGSANTASGLQSLFSNTEGTNNTASGHQALLNNTGGNYNTASGIQALLNNTTGSGNTALNPRTSAGTYAPVFDPTTEDNRFCMGSTGVTNAYIQVAWTVVSDARDKTEIAPVPHGLAFVNALKPTSFRYKIDRDATEGHGHTRYGFLAQDILAIEGDNPVIIDNEQPDKLRMTDQSLIAVMVNAIQEQQEIIKNLETRLLVLETK